MSSPAQRRLDIYLNDHLTGASAGVRLARRVADTHRGGPHGRELDVIAGQIAEDREALLEIMRRADVEPRRVYVWMGRLGEAAGRLKPNGRLVRGSELKNLIELEAMRLGVLGKLQGWTALAAAAQGDPRLDRERLRTLVDRAESQAAALERMHVATSDMLAASRAGVGTPGYAS